MPVRKPYFQILTRVTELGYRLQSSEEEYNKVGVNKLMILCNGCDTPHRVQLSDLEKIPAGTKRCITCGVKKRAESRAKNSGVHYNIQNYFSTMNYKLISTEEEIREGMKVKKDNRSIPLLVRFKCDQDHINELEYASFNNKKLALKNKVISSFCVECHLTIVKNTPEHRRERMINEIMEIFKPFNHKLVELEPDNNGIKFICGFCRNEAHNELRNIRRSDYSGKCLSCSGRKDFQELKKEVEDMGFQLLMNDYDYTDNKNITVGCQECVNYIWRNISLSDVKRKLIKHYHCQDCMTGCHGAIIKHEFEPYCMKCFGIHNPNADIPRRFRLKENYFTERVNTFLNETKLDIDYHSISMNKELGGCSKRRPDIFIDCFTHCIVGELDEKQHSGYSCENKRMCELMQDVNNRPIVFLRLNPDSYRTESNVKIPSCFMYTPKGEMRIWEAEWEKRFSVFTDKLKHHLTHIPDKEMTIEHLYYNELSIDDEEDVEIVQDWSEGKLSDNRHRTKLNQYRICKDDKGTYLEVKLQNGFVFYCDVEHLPVVESRVWSLKTVTKKKDNMTYYYVKCRQTHSQKEELFHKVTFAHYKSHTFLDKNALNCRSYNLRNI